MNTTKRASAFTALLAAASMLTAAIATADTPSRTVRIAAVNSAGGVVTSVSLASIS